MIFLLSFYIHRNNFKSTVPQNPSFLGSGPDRGRSPVEWGDFPSVRSYVRSSVHSFVRPSAPPPLGKPARPEAHPARPEAQPARPEAQPASQPSLRLQAWLDGPKGGNGRTNGRTNGRKISPFYRTLSP